MSSRQQIVLGTEALQIGYRQGSKPTVVAENLNLKLHPGQLICLLGPNGSGKSTLIRTLAGMHPALGGSIELFGEPMADMASKMVARKLSTVLTDRVTVGNLSVFQLVSFGRSPHTGWLGSLKEVDKKKVEWAIEATGLQDFLKRDISRLSDGELQKVMVARALAQDTSVILLDEPTAHLDLPNRVEIIRLLRKLARETEKAILLSTHELDLALKAGDRLWLMNRDRALFDGVPEDLVLNGTFERVFQKDSFDFDRETGSFTLHHPSNGAIALQGDPIPKFWIRRALQREGVRINENAPITLEAKMLNSQMFEWLLKEKNEEKTFETVDQLISFLRKMTK